MKIISKHEPHVATQEKNISVRGSVVDVRFESDLPSIYTVLHAGASRETSIEVLSQLNHRKPTLSAPIREHLFVSLSKACTESLASENASRLAAMQRAEKNIDELLDDLTSSFHRLRQRSIDEELFDVVSGFENMKKDDAEKHKEVSS